jgi:hypothetical protein
VSGRKIAAALSDASGCRTEIHADHFAIDAEDTDWIPEIGRRGWILVTKDSGIMRKEHEKQALLNAKVRALIFMDALLARDVMIELIQSLMPAMLRHIDRYEAPFVFGIELPDRLVELSPLTLRQRVT